MRSIIVVYRETVMKRLRNRYGFTLEEAELFYIDAPAAAFDDKTPEECADYIASHTVDKRL